eukprot:evm.model.NODE_36777_length_11168_cov_58.634762.1
MGIGKGSQKAPAEGGKDLDVLVGHGASEGVHTRHVEFAVVLGLYQEYRWAHG